MDLSLAPCVGPSVSIKPSDALRFLGALAAALVLGVLLVLRITSAPDAAQARPPAPAATVAPAPPARPASVDCAAGPWSAAARANAASLRTLAWAPFRRPEIGWETYAPLIGREIGSACPPYSFGFAAALAGWQAAQRLPADGVFTDPVFARLRTVVRLRGPLVQVSARGVCPPPPLEATLVQSRPDEGYGNKIVSLRPAVLDAWRRMAAAARAESPAVAADPRNLTLFSGYRSPESDADRCVLEGNCDGIARAKTCSPHRTGLAIDLYVGQAPGYGPDSTADPNRLFMSRTAAYGWMLANAHRFGFVNYPFEPWHWEWTGEAR